MHAAVLDVHSRRSQRLRYSQSLALPHILASELSSLGLTVAAVVLNGGKNAFEESPDLGGNAVLALTDGGIFVCLQVECDFLWLCAGKTSVARTLAGLAGQELVELALNGGTDTSDLLGGFEQLEPGRRLQVSSLMTGRVKFQGDLCTSPCP